MILAAGFGTRLLPYTELRPKPLFPLLNTPLLLLLVRRLQNAGFDHIIVNCHYLREQIVAALHGLRGVVVQEEEMVLGTGGGLRLALSVMRDEPLLITNGDIYHTVDFKTLYEAHTTGHTAVTMAMHDYPRFNTVSVQGDRVTGFDDSITDSKLAFTGLHVIDPVVLEPIPQLVNHSIIDRYRELLEEGQPIQSLRVDGCSWTDMGTVEDYLELHGRLLRKEIPRWQEFEMEPEGGFLLPRDMDRSNLSLQEWACVGDVTAGSPITLRRCVVWDDADLTGCTRLCSDALLS